MNYLLSILLFLCATFFIHPLSFVHAAGEFQADYDVQYAISPTGRTIVTQHVTLTNKLSNFYPQKYSLLLDSDKITNVIAYDDGGVITPKISVKDGKTDVSLSFNSKAVGLGKALKFSLRYEHAGIATKNGSIWEVYVPGIVNDPDVSTYDVSLSIPASFGENAYISPLPSGNNKWSKEQMIRGGISAAYGTKQQYALDLTYSLLNTALTPKTQTIALPPETAYQSVSIISLDPRPQSVTKDADGNWLATFLVPAKQTIAVKTKLNVSVYLSPSKNYTETPQNFDSLLSEQPFWEISDTQIKQYAQLYKTPKDIYSFVVRTLSYDYSRINKETKRLGAKAILKSPSTALCMEFTDLFIAIARAAHIPARRVVGYAYTNNSKLRPLSLVTDVLHAWPEYYDSEKKLWIPIDPTWANTTGGQNYFDKLDFNHIVFAIQGENSEKPYPAGFYHDSSKNMKDILVEFSESSPKEQKETIETEIVFPDQVTAGTLTKGTVVIKNTSGTSIENILVSVHSNDAQMRIRKEYSQLLPFGTIYVPIEATFAKTVSSKKASIQATTNDATVTKELTIVPYFSRLSIISFSVFVIACIILLLWIFIWKNRKK